MWRWLLLVGVALARDFDEDGVSLLSHRALPTLERVRPSRPAQGSDVERWRSELGLDVLGLDARSFAWALLVHGAIAVGGLAAVSELRRRFPAVFARVHCCPGIDSCTTSATMGQPAAPEPETLLAAARDAYERWLADWRMEHEEARELGGLDRALLLEFQDLALRLLLLLGLPQVLLLCPVHLAQGGQGLQLRRLGFANVPRDSWVCWLHVAVVWYVVLAGQLCLFAAQSRFLERRVLWLRGLSFPRSHAVLVLQVPPEHRSDAGLLRFTSDLFGAAEVRSCRLALHAPRLPELLLKVEEQELRLSEAVRRSSLTLSDTAHASAAQLPRPSTLLAAQRLPELRRGLASLEGAALQTRLQRERAALAEARRELEAEEERLRLELGNARSQVYSSSAFVTFQRRQMREYALSKPWTQQRDRFQVTQPPDPEDVLWSSLLTPSHQNVASGLLGLLAAVLLFVTFLPLVVGITSIAKSSNLERWLSGAGLALHPRLGQAWDALAAPVLLTLLMSFVPMVLMMTFERCYVLKSKAKLQLKVQIWYTHFLVIFVLLITLLGSSLVHTLEKVLAEPLSLLPLMASSMPQASQFYLGWMMAQWGTLVLFASRYQNLCCFLSLRLYVGEREAAELSEPEDQQYSGIGAHCARQTLQLLICVVFGSLSPVICLVGLATFALGRLVFAALLRAETRKPDLGGEHWVAQLRHLQLGLGIYALLMGAVLLERHSSRYPGLLALASLVFLAVSTHRFHSQFQWEHLSLEALKGCDDERPSLVHESDLYEQPELSSGRVRG